MDLAIGTYLKVLDRSGVLIPGYAWQNFHQQETRVYDSVSYAFAGFGYSGGSVDIEAANIEASLLFGANTLALNVFKQAAQNNWLAEVRTVWLDPDTLVETAEHLLDLYQVKGYSNNQQTVNVRLGSPDDASSANFPRRRLTTALVGYLPTTGQIALS